MSARSPLLFRNSTQCCCAGASAAAWSCGDSVAIVELEVTAKALAEATAVAVSFAYAECEVDGGYACSVASTEIEQTAYAVAHSYASLWAGALTCKDTCSVNVDAVAEAVGDILVKAATDAFSAVCTGAPCCLSLHTDRAAIHVLHVWNVECHSRTFTWFTLVGFVTKLKQSCSRAQQLRAVFHHSVGLYVIECN